MFGKFFKKKESEADAAIGVMDSAIKDAAIKWVVFEEGLSFSEDVSVMEKIAFFEEPFSKFVRAKYSELANAPDEIIFLIIAKGIVESGKYTRDSLEAELGLKIP